MSGYDDRTQVVLFTSQYVIHGWISLVPGARLTDFVREAETFIAVTECVVRDHQDRELFRAAFMDVRRDAIDMAVPSTLHRPSVPPPEPPPEGA